MKLAIIGASGHGKVIADIAVLNGYTEIVFYDDDPEKKECAGYPVLGRSMEVAEDEIFVAIGNAEARRKLMEYYAGKKQPVLVHPAAVAAKDAVIEMGTVLMAGAVVNPGVKIGKGVIVNTCSSIDHDCIIEDYAHVSVGAHLCGTVKVGRNTWIGAGAIVSNNVRICSDCMIGAGAVVVKDIVIPGTYVGVPAKKKQS